MVINIMSKKAIRHSGWVTAVSTIKNKRKIIINECLEPQLFYDDWQDKRDGQRNIYGDKTKIKNKIFTKFKYNNKLKKFINIRKARKNVNK